MRLACICICRVFREAKTIDGRGRAVYRPSHNSRCLPYYHLRYCGRVVGIDSIALRWRFNRNPKNPSARSAPKPRRPRIQLDTAAKSSIIETSEGSRSS